MPPHTHTHTHIQLQQDDLRKESKEAAAKLHKNADGAAPAPAPVVPGYPGLTKADVDAYIARAHIAYVSAPTVAADAEPGLGKADLDAYIAKVKSEVDAVADAREEAGGSEGSSSPRTATIPHPNEKGRPRRTQQRKRR